MKKFLIEAKLVCELRNSSPGLMPEQRDRVEKLMKSGIILNYSLSMDRKKLWFILNAVSALEARRIIRTLPINDIVEFKVHDLMFHYSGVPATPQFWLN